VQLSNENFPEKSYGNVVLPQGEYEAFRIIIGEGNGHNWWCVMFPPLCFVDESKAVTQYEKSEQTLEEKSKKSEEQNKKKDEEENAKKIKYKFKIVEILKEKL